MECQRIVKSYDGKSIKLSGFSIGDIKLGELGIEPKLIQAASQALLILDASQYDLCVSIRNVSDETTRQEFIKRMVEDKLQAQKIFRAFALLSLNPTGNELQSAISMLASSVVFNEQRTKELEDSNIIDKIYLTDTSNTPSDTTANSKVVTAKKEQESILELGKEIL